MSKERFKKICKLNNPKYRVLRGDSVRPTNFDILIEGERLVSQVVEDSGRGNPCGYPISPTIKALYIRNDKINQYQHILSKIDAPKYILTDHQSTKLSETQNEQGIFAQIEFTTKPIINYNKLLYLNGIGDTGNLGTIIRTASAFAIDGVIIDDKCCDIANSKVIRASMGSIFFVPILQADYDWLENRKENIYIADAHNGTALSKFEFPTSPYILVLGSEAHGVSLSISKLAKEKIYIDATGNMESLNVAIAAGIFMYKMELR